MKVGLVSRQFDVPYGTPNEPQLDLSLESVPYGTSFWHRQPIAWRSVEAAPWSAPCGAAFVSRARIVFRTEHTLGLNRRLSLGSVPYGTSFWHRHSVALGSFRETSPWLSSCSAPIECSVRNMQVYRAGWGGVTCGLCLRGYSVITGAL